ncbi:MAG: DUF4738 domain-containing protein, partial [Bacteroidaceae bacterium]|nr:DUF4738 domain-containing protein [Bacteroidaceae bacterium]
KLVTGFHIHDTTAGFKCYRRRVLQTIELDKIRFKGYGFQIEMKFTAWKIGFKIKEVPVIFVNRREGTSKMSGGIFGEAFFGVMRLRWDGWTRKYPKIAMMLLAALMTASACQEKKQTGDIITASYTPQQPQAPIALPADSQTVDVQWKGSPYVVRIVRTPVDSLLVTDDGGQEYYDNAVRLSVKRQDGSVLFSKTFTKNTFASYVQNPFRRMGVLGGIQFDEVSGQNLKFSVVIGLPDALDDVYVPLEMTIDSQGGLGIRQTDDMNLRDDIDADE